MEEKPYIIFTLRRTGGTSLMAFLAKVSAFPRLQHEPLNRDRVWGAVTRRFDQTRDHRELAAALTQLLVPRPNIKHCIELVPMAVTCALIDATLALGYRAFVLTRRDEIGRLISLALAMATGAWGPVQAEKRYPLLLSGRVSPVPLEPEEIVLQAERDAQALGRILAYFRDRGTTPDRLVFEDIYKSQTAPEIHALRIARSLGVALSDDDPRLAALRERQGTGSASIEGMIPGIADLRERLRNALVT